MLHPSSTSAVSGALALCYEYRIPVATRGAGTGLEGGAILAKGLDGVVLSRSSAVLKVSTCGAYRYRESKEYRLRRDGYVVLGRRGCEEDPAQ